MMRSLLSFGHGYSARAFADGLPRDIWRVTGTTRSEAKAAGWRDKNVISRIWPGADLSADIAAATHVLVSAAPTADGDPVFAEWADAIAQAPNLEWFGYLSTTGVYGDHNGGWVDETTPLTPSTIRGQHRLRAECQWQSLVTHGGLPLHIFRLAGIYGPGRGPFAKVRNGTARCIVKPNQVFSRIHVDDIAQVLCASVETPNPGAVYNVCDNEAAPPQDVIRCAAKLLGRPSPPDIAIEDADMTPMARSFYAESKRVRNDRIVNELGVVLRYPDYRSGLKALLAQEGLTDL